MRMILAIILGSVFSTQVQAAVTMKTLNYFETFRDVEYTGGLEFVLDRVYNSKGNPNDEKKDIFGFQWASNLLKFLQTSSDASVVVHEFGGGAENRFNPIKMNAKEIQAAAVQIADAKKKLGAFGTDSLYKSEIDRLTTNATYRNDEWSKLVRQGVLKPRQLPIGAQLISNRFSYQFITRVKGGYVLTFDSGRVEYFDDVGLTARLSKIQDKNNNHIDYEYDKDGHLVKIKDNIGRGMWLSYDSRGLLTKVEGTGGKTAEYKYNSRKEMISSVDFDGHKFTYKYDDGGRHNLTEIGYSDGTSVKVSYQGRDKREDVKEVIDRNGNKTKYNADISADHLTRKISVTMLDPKDKLISDSKYEYYFKVKIDGEEWIYKLIATVDGSKTETIYNECCSLPIIIKDASGTTAFSYDTKGRVTKKDTPQEVTELEYDQKASKVSRVTNYLKLKKNGKPKWSQFQYDDSGNLLMAWNSDGKKLKLLYPTGSGLIKAIIDVNGHRVIEFEYDKATSKPTKITEPGVGAITVLYKQSGEVDKVDYPKEQGRKIAMEVTATFEQLLEVIRPAGVTLGPS